MFYVDDRFYGSGPVLRIPRVSRAAAIGTWLLCGTWSAAFLKDGYVPEHMVDELGGTIAGAEFLVEVGLWRRHRNGGYVFKDWAKWQKTRAQVEKYREGERARKALARAKPVTTGPLPSGQPQDSEVSNPHPSTKPTDDRDPSEGEARRAPASTDGPSSHNGYKPVETGRADLGRILDRIRELVGAEVELHPLHASAVAEYFLSRKRGEPPRMATRYVLACITKHANAVANYLHSGRWSE
jgi:hypothetical protein